MGQRGVFGSFTWALPVMWVGFWTFPSTRIRLYVRQRILGVPCVVPPSNFEGSSNTDLSTNFAELWSFNELWGFVKLWSFVKLWGFVELLISRQMMILLTNFDKKNQFFYFSLAQTTVSCTIGWLWSARITLIVLSLQQLNLNNGHY